MNLRGIPVAVVLLAAQPAFAEDEFIKGLYLQTEELCAQAKKDGVETVAEAGNTILSSRGLDSVEYNCEFVQINKAKNSPAWAVTAICSEPGYIFPDVLTVTQLSPTQIELVSVKPVAEEGESDGNGGSYVLCDGLKMP